MTKKRETSLDRLKAKMKTAAQLKPTIRRAPGQRNPHIEMKDGQSYYEPEFDYVRLDEFEKPEMQLIARTAVIDHNPEWEFKKIENVVFEDVCPGGKLYDLKLQVVNGNKTCSVKKMVWSGNCYLFTDKARLFFSEQQSNLLDLSDKKIHDKFQDLARAAFNQYGLPSAAFDQDDLDVDVEVVRVNEDSVRIQPRGNTGFFKFTSYTILIKVETVEAETDEENPETEEAETDEENPEPNVPFERRYKQYAVSMLETSWILTLDDSKADFYRFRQSVAMEPHNKLVDIRGPYRVDSPKRPLTEIDLMSPKFEIPSMFFIEIYNYKERENLSFERVVWAAKPKYYSLRIQANDNHGGVCYFETEVCTTYVEVVKISSYSKIEHMRKKRMLSTVIVKGSQL